jgi:hypothetical protein
MQERIGTEVFDDGEAVKPVGKDISWLSATLRCVLGIVLGSFMVMISAIGTF